MQMWTKVLPFFIVEWLAKKNLERFTIMTTKQGETVVIPYKGVYIKVK